MMNEKHFQDVLKLTLDQVQSDGDQRFFQRLLKLRVKECLQNGTYRVIYDGEAFAGFVRWNLVKEGAVLEALLISDAYRGQGYLDQLWNGFLEDCKTQGVKQIFSYAEKDDYVNLSFHQFLGFRLESDRDAEKYLWIYDLKDTEERLQSYHNLPWLTVQGVDGEL